MKVKPRLIVASSLVLLIAWLIFHERRCIVVRAADAGWRTGVALALGLGMSPNATCNGTTLLHAAVGSDSDIVALLISRGALVNEKSRGTAPLVAAAASGNTKSVQLLLQAGANPNTRWSHDDSILIAPIHNGYRGIAQQLIAAGTKVRADSAALLIEAVRADNVDLGMIELLLDSGADINAANERGTTSLMFAAGDADIGTVRFLLAHGADASAKDGDGRTAEDWARRAEDEIALTSRDMALRAQRDDVIHLLETHRSRR